MFANIGDLTSIVISSEKKLSFTVSESQIHTMLLQPVFAKASNATQRK